MIYTLTKLARRMRKSPQNGRFLEERHTKNLQYCVETHVQVEPLLDDRHQDVCTYGGPDLRLQRRPLFMPCPPSWPSMARHQIEIQIDFSCLARKGITFKTLRWCPRNLTGH